MALPHVDSAHDDRDQARRTPRVLKLRYGGVCCICRVDLPRATEARWDPQAHTVTCLGCIGGKGHVEGGTAGGSAAKEAARRRAKKAEADARLKREHPVLGRLRLILVPEPDPGREWEVGAIGEQKLGAMLESLADQGVVALHDRRLPGSSANIDHLAITANGIWVIDAKRFTGRLDLKVSKGQLYCKGHSQAKLRRQVEAVHAALEVVDVTGVPVCGALCFIDADVGNAEPMTVRGMHVTWPKPLAAQLTAPGELDADDRSALLRLLARSFAPTR